ncbi:adenosylcobinamide-phosphate synthase CbiB [Tepidibacillus infernus]|uniref:adenosylcobinamide-phosphate synthase CbiB n=1 Tax=Tepidibacillus infernus TaxID=1806172 RepID=UPI003B744649
MNQYLYWQVIAAFLIDLWIGDPKQLTHPVVLIGKAIRNMETFLRRFTFHFSERLLGIILVIIIVGSSYGLVWLILFVMNQVHLWLSLLVGAWLISTTIATKGLADEGKKLFSLLKAKELEEAKKQVGYIVSRDTDHLDESEVIRATVETIAENIVDAVISPLFYAILGGPALAMVYRAANTLDSMCGYKNERYRDFGFASARFDDLLNYIPARITGVLIVLAAWLLQLDAKKSLSIWFRDAHLHPSPNSGIPEASVAGALHIRLGGVNIYFGQPKKRAYMGDDLKPLQVEHIQQTIQLLYGVSGIFIGLYTVIFWSLYFTN